MVNKNGKKENKINFFHTLLFKIIAAFLTVFVVPSILTIGVIPTFYTSIMTDQVNLLTNTVIDTAINNINSYIEELERLLMAPYMDEYTMTSLYTLKKLHLEKKTTDRKYYEAKNTVQDTLKNYIQFIRNDIVGILICFDEENAITFYDKDSKSMEDFDFGKEFWYQLVVDADGKSVFISRHFQDYLNEENPRQIFSVARLIKNVDSKTPIAIIKLDVDESVLSGIMKGIHLNVSSIMTIVDTNGEILYSNQKISNDMRELIKKSNDKKIEVDGKIYNVISKDIKGTNWMIRTLVSETEYVQKINEIQIRVIMVYFIAAAMTVLLFSYFTSKITKPLKILSGKMRQVENGDFSVRFHVKKKDEIASIGNTFNVMTEHLNDRINREYRAVIALQKAEYHALQSQIEPHFLYNVLNNMLGVNRMGDKELMEKMIIALAGMLRFMTNQTDTVCVNEEIDMLDKYCQLQKMQLNMELSHLVNKEQLL